MKYATIIALFLSVLAATPKSNAEVPTKWKRFNTFDVNATSYAIWYYSDINYGAYDDAQSIFTEITQKCANVSFPGSHDTPVYWGISSDQNNDVMLYSDRVNVDDGVQKCISSYFRQGVANSVSGRAFRLVLVPLVIVVGFLIL